MDKLIETVFEDSISILICEHHNSFVSLNELGSQKIASAFFSLSRSLFLLFEALSVAHTHIKPIETEWLCDTILPFSYQTISLVTCSSGREEKIGNPVLTVGSNCSCLIKKALKLGSNVLYVVIPNEVGDGKTKNKK